MIIPIDKTPKKPAVELNGPVKSIMGLIV